jgi:hypothetical protein
MALGGLRLLIWVAVLSSNRQVRQPSLTVRARPVASRFLIRPQTANSQQPMASARSNPYRILHAKLPLLGSSGRYFGSFDIYEARGWGVEVEVPGMFVD